MLRIIEGAVQAMGTIVQMRDPYTAGHQQRVAVLAAAIAGEMGLPDTRIVGLRMAARVHDVGKICVPSEILSKPGRLTEIEFSLIKTHCRLGYEILKDIEFPWPVAEIALQHHERMNGSGYPRGLSGDEILLEARILGVTDVVETISSHRPYRPALGIDKAIEEIVEHGGITYDAEVVTACVRVINRRGFAFH